MYVCARNAYALIMPIFNNCCSVMRVSPEEATEQCHIESLDHNGHICRPFFNKMRICALEMMLVVCDTLQDDLHVKENYLTASAMKQREFSYPIVLMLVYY